MEFSFFEAAIQTYRSGGDAMALLITIPRWCCGRSST
jgi:hypothetical protein